MATRVLREEIGKGCSYTPKEIQDYTIDALIDIGYRFSITNINEEDEDDDLEVCDYGNTT